MLATCIAPVQHCRANLDLDSSGGPSSPRKRFRRDSGINKTHEREPVQRPSSPACIASPSGQGTIPGSTSTTSIEPGGPAAETAPSLVPGVMPPQAVGSLAGSLAKLKDEAHANRLAVQQRLVEGKGTEEAYGRHIKNYLVFWSSSQDRKVEEDPQWVRIPAHPIIGDKVAIFLQHETTRRKRDHHGNEISGTSVGKNSIAQCISALQSYVNEHQHDLEYRNCSEVHIPLRNQPCIKTFEKAACANEPTRVCKAHIVKSKGTMSDTYTVDELIRMSIWCLSTFRGSKTQVHTGIRDRTMLLLSTTTAFRGDSSRRVLWSDLLSRKIPMMDINLESELVALVVLADQAKTNSSGRVDEHGVFRHRYPELCCIGGLGFYLFSHFHILGKATPTFIPDFSDTNHKEYGRRDWYGLYLFPGKGEEPEGMNEMTYENHRERINLMHVRNKIAISKVTHAGRGFTASNARQHRASANDTKALGRWSTGDSYMACYDRALPTSAMLAAAMFNAEKPESYSLSREYLELPSELIEFLFPWVEAEMRSYDERVEAHGKRAVDYMLRHFLQLLELLRKVILQDAAVLYSKYPNCAIWTFPPFNTTIFRNFAANSTSLLAQAEADCKKQLKSLPKTVAMSMHGILEQNIMERRRELEQQCKNHEEMKARLNYMEAMILESKKSSRGQRRTCTSNTPMASSRSSPAPTVVTASSSFDLQTMVLDIPPPPPPFPNINTQPATYSFPLQLPSLTVNDSHDHVWPQDLTAYTHNFKLSTQDFEREAQIVAIRNLLQKYGRDRIQNHQFEWITYSSGSIADEWLPIYLYKVGISLWDIWEEWTNGLDGHISIRQLNDGWDARWRRNNSGQKTEAGRRKKVVELIEALAKKPNWNIQLALQFLKEKYPIPSSSQPYLKSTRAFIEHLQKRATGKEAFQAILLASSSYCSS